MKKKILILGKNGQLAKVLQEKIIKINAIIVNLSSKECNFENYKKIPKIIKKYKPNIIINCSAYTQVDNAELNKLKCKKINDYAVHEIAKFCKKNNIFLIHFSSDYIFNISKKVKKPIVENYKKSPINYYGKTKLDGEKKIINSGCKYIIIRLSWTYSKYGQNFLKFVIKNLNQKKKINIVNDQFGSPTNLDYVVIILIKLIRKLFKSNQEESLIINYSHNGLTSWFKYALKIQKIFYPNLNKKLIYPIASKKFKSLANRPKYSKLSNAKIKRYLNIKIYKWEYYLKKSLLKNSKFFKQLGYLK